MKESVSVIGLVRLIGLMRLICISLILCGLTVSVTGEKVVIHGGMEDQCYEDNVGPGGLCWSDGSDKGRHFLYLLDGNVFSRVCLGECPCDHYPWCHWLGLNHTERQWQRQRQTPMQVNGDAWKSVPDPFPSVTIYFHWPLPLTLGVVKALDPLPPCQHGPVQTYSLLACGRLAFHWKVFMCKYFQLKNL